MVKLSLHIPINNNISPTKLAVVGKLIFDNVKINKNKE